MYSTRLAENTGCKKLPSRRHHTNLSACIFSTKACIDNQKKNLVNSNTSSRRPHNMVKFGPVTAEIISGVWGTPANFNGFRVFVSLLHWRHSTKVNQILHSIWPSPGLVHYIHFQGLLPLTEFCQVHNSLCVQVFRCLLLAALLHDTRAVGVSQTLQSGTRTGITELLLLVIFNKGATYIPRAAIALDIGPYSCILYKIKTFT